MCISHRNGTSLIGGLEWKGRLVNYHLLTAGVALASVVIASASVRAATIFAIDNGPNQQLVTFDSSDPGQLLTAQAVLGLQSNEQLVGIDFRPMTGELFAVGSSSRIYKVDFTSTVGVASLLQVGSGPFSPALNGQEFGIDFNPTVDRIRETSNFEQNLRLNPITGAVAGTDTLLAYASGDISFGKNPGIVGSAYTNNFAGATTTTLFNIDHNFNTLVRQGSADGSVGPNTGKLYTVGVMNVDTNALVGFDITDGDVAFVSLTTPGDLTSALYRISLSNGALTPLGNIGDNDGTMLIRGIAVQSAVPEPTTLLGLATLSAAMLLRRRANVA